MNPTSPLLEENEAPVAKEVFGWLEKCAECDELSDVSGLQPLQGYACWKCGAKMEAMKRLGKFELVALVGTGGMGCVYRALDTILDRTVAVKLLVGEITKDPARRAALLREAMMTASINHAHIVKIYDAAVVGEICYVVMELLEHGTLAEAISRSASLPEADVLTYGVQLADGLRAASRKGLLHRDIKPANILFGDEQTVKLVDFGLACTTGEAALKDAAAWGSPHYVSPERASGGTEDIRSDIYSLACTLYHALAGRAPFEGEDPEAVTRKRISSTAPNVRTFAPHVTESTAAVLAEALQRQPADRFQNYDELIEALEVSRHALANRASRPASTGGAPNALAAHPVSKRGRGKVFALASVLIVGGLGAVAWTQGWIPREWIGLVHSAPAAAGVEEAGFRSYAAPYSAARTQMLRGEFGPAAAAFGKIVQDAKAPAAAHDWARFGEGLSWLFAGDLPKAKEAMQGFEPDPQQNRDAARAFLVQTARQCASGAPLPKVLSAGVEQNSGQALGLLAYGLVDWNLRDYDDSAALLREFKSAALADASWIKECQALADPFLRELSAMERLDAFDRSAPKAEQTKALKALREAQSGFRLKSPLLAKYQRKLDELGGPNGGGNAGAQGGANSNAAYDLGPWGAPASISVSLGAPAKINRWVVRKVIFGHRDTEVTLKLEASDDGQAWHEIDSYSGGPQPIDRQTSEFSAGYVRVTLSESGKADPDHRIAGFELHGPDGLVTNTPPGNLNIARKKPVYDQGNSVEVHPPPAMVDGDPTAHWEATVSPCWLVVDMGEPKAIDRWVTVNVASTTTPAHGRPSAWNAATYKLQASDDAEKWRDIDTVTDNLYDVTDRRVPGFIARYVRFYGLKASINGDFKTRVAELLLYAPGSSAK